MMTVTRRPSMTYLARMISVLDEHGELTVTNLAMMSRMNHKRCITLILWLQDSGYARTRLSKKRRYVALTQTGREYAKRVQEVRDMTHHPTRSAYEMYVRNVSDL